MMKACRGVTIIELLVSSSVFLLIMGMVCQAVVVAYRAQSKTVDKVQARREALTMLGQLKRELQTTRPGMLLSGVPLNPGPAQHLVLRRNGPNQTLVQVEYWLQPLGPNQPAEIRRLGPGDPSGGQVMVRNVRGFDVVPSGTPNMVRARVWVATLSAPIEMEGRLLQ
ncbi:MAG: hypothetical protein AMXMBFR33_27680 [Candidatus Xenobia bacterium]